VEGKLRGIIASPTDREIFHSFRSKYNI